MGLVACGGSRVALITIGCLLLAGDPWTAQIAIKYWVRDEDPRDALIAIRILVLSKSWATLNKHKVFGACGGPLGRTNDHGVLDAGDHTNHNRVIVDLGGPLGHANNHRALGACCGFLDRTKHHGVHGASSGSFGRTKHHGVLSASWRSPATWPQ